MKTPSDVAKVIAPARATIASGKDALEKAYAWARANKGCVDVKLPQGVDEQRSKHRFEAGIGSWIELRHPDGRSWAVRERRASRAPQGRAPAETRERTRNEVEREKGPSPSTLAT